DNFSIFRDSLATGSEEIAFDIRSIQLTDLVVTYDDEQEGHHHEFSTPSLQASVSLRDGGYDIITLGTVDIGQIGIGDRTFLKGKSFRSGLSLKFNPEAKTVDIMPSELRLGNAVFNAEGYYDFHESPRMDLSLKGQNTTIGTMLSFLPSEIAAQFTRYESEGDLYFSLQLVGSPEEAPGLAFSITFGARNAVLFHPETGFKMDAANIDGKLSVIGDGGNEVSELLLSKASGNLNGKPFRGNFRLRNFSDPRISLTYAGELEAPTLDQLLPDTIFSGTSGSLMADVSISGKLNDLRNKKTAYQVTSSGTITLNGFSVAFGAEKIPFTGWNGRLRFDGNDLMMDGVSGKIGKTDLAMTGEIKNLLTFLLHDGQKIGMSARIESTFLDLDDLLAYGYGKQNRKGYTFSISPRIGLRVEYEVGRLNYRRFNALDLKGKLNVTSGKATLEKNRFRSMGGTVSLDGIVDGSDARVVDLDADLKTKDVLLDSLFYVFEDFNQQFITARHLRGQVTSDITLRARLTPELELVQDRLVADLSLLIRKGELNDFEPILKLNKYLDDSGLRKLRFADLKNDIHIQDKTVFIPRMEIRSNLTTIQLSGKHTFDQHIDYRIVAPITGRRNINREEAGTAFVEDKGGQSKLYLKITGTTDNYQVGYDMAAVKEKISGQIRQEIKSLKESFKVKPKEPKKKLEIAEDEFFEWENEQ
ncbi:MAG: AsmA-like C-terminal region-containing protein, partial [Bacteroidota bacterium]